MHTVDLWRLDRLLAWKERRTADCTAPIIVPMLLCHIPCTRGAERYGRCKHLTALSQPWLPKCICHMAAPAMGLSWPGMAWHGMARVQHTASCSGCMCMWCMRLVQAAGGWGMHATCATMACTPGTRPLTNTACFSCQLPAGSHARPVHRVRCSREGASVRGTSTRLVCQAGAA